MRNFPLPTVEDAKTIVDVGIDDSLGILHGGQREVAHDITDSNIARWRTGLDKHDSAQLCNSLIFHFWDAAFSSCCILGGCGSREEFDLRGQESYFLIFSVIYRLVAREWEVVGSGKLYSQTESSSSIYCSLLQFLADCLQRCATAGCEDHGRVVLARLLWDEEGPDLCDEVVFWCSRLKILINDQASTMSTNLPVHNHKADRSMWFQVLLVLLIPRIHLCIGRPFKRTISEMRLKFNEKFLGSGHRRCHVDFIYMEGM